MDQYLLAWKKSMKEEIKKQVLQQINKIHSFSSSKNIDKHFYFQTEIQHQINDLNSSILIIKQQISNIKNQFSTSDIVIPEYSLIKKKNNEQEIKKDNIREKQQFKKDFENLLEKVSHNMDLDFTREEPQRQTSKKYIKTQPSLMEETQFQEKQAQSPKRPKNTFFLFKDEVYEHVKARYPDKKSSEIVKIIAKMWEKCDEGTKARIEAKYKSNKKLYNEEKKVVGDQVSKYERRKKN